MKSERILGILCTSVALSLSLQAAGPLQRVANTSLTNMPAQPPTFGFTSANAFPGLTFLNPVCLVTPPGETNRLFVVEKAGRIVVITNLASPARTIFMDITSSVTNQGDAAWFGEQGLLGLAFHPGYATNRYFYVFYTGYTNGGPRHDILARFQTMAANTNQGDASTRQTLFAQYDEADNHNAGDLHFGPDGYLYVSLGDEGGAQGQYNNTQRITNDFFSGILRIDVDKRATNAPPNPQQALLGQTNYFVPADNPFIGATSFNGFPILNTNTIRTEFWAVGLRNPWRFTFDTDGTLYCGDVGQGAGDGNEEVDVIVKGANYGWNFWGGTVQRTNPTPAGFVHTPPIIDYPRIGTYAAIVGGVVYRGQKFSQLYGSYIYGDSDDGRIWALKYNGTNVTENILLFTDSKDVNSSDATIAAFGTDPSNGDILYCDLNNGTDSRIKRIVYSNTTNGAPIPPLLSGTGAFTNLSTLSPAAGIVPYDLNVPFWSDNAIKSRWFSVPNTNLTIGFSSNANWSFPTSSVWIKHFELEITNGVPASRKRLETRFIVRNTNGVYGVTYRWTTPPTNAILVAEDGLNEVFTNYNSGGSIISTQVWHYPSRIECLQCHSVVGGHALGFNTPQLNRDYTYGASTTNQLLALSLAGYFSTNVTGVENMIALAHATNASASLEFRTRSYLAANCAQCHQPGGLAHSAWSASIWTPLTNAGIINGPLLNNLGDTNNRVVVPGVLSNSVMLTRISTPSLRMPPLASSVLDTQAISLVTTWIGSLTTAPGNFSLTASPATATAKPGDSTNYSITVTATNGFSDNVTLSVSGLPAGATYSLTPTNINGSGASTLNVTTSTNVAAGNYLLTITGISGALTNSTTATLSVNDFSVSASPGARTILAGSGTNFTITVSASNGFTGNVTLTVSGMPAGASYNLSQTNINGAGASTLSVTTSNNIPAGDYLLTITGTSGGLAHSASVTLSVNDFSVSAAPASRVLIPGNATNYTVTVGASNGFSGSVTLSVSGLPAGANYSLTQTNVSGPGASTLNVTTSSNIVAGDYLLTITATSGGLTRSKVVTLSVNDFSISAAPASRVLVAGNTTNYIVTVGASNGFSGSVTLSVSGLPAGASHNLSQTNLNGAGASTLNVVTSNNIAAGDYLLTITGTSGGLARSATVTLGVNDFSVFASPASRTVMASGSTNYTVTVGASNGFSGNVTLSLSGLPAGAGYALSQTNLSGSGSSALSVTTSSGISAGTYPLTISGISGGLTRSDSVNLVIVAAPTPRFTGVLLDQNRIILLGTNGVPGGNYHVLDATNLTLPLNIWSLRATSVFEANGDFAFTNTLDPDAPQLFYRLRLP